MAPTAALGSAADEAAAREGPRGWGHQLVSRLLAGCGGGGGKAAATCCHVPSRRIGPEEEGGLEEPQSVAGVRRPSGRRASVGSHGEQAFNTQAFVPERVNAQIARRYKINKQELGAGGYGRVFLAEDLEIPGRLVAIKKVCVIRRSRKLAFQQEAAVMKRLDHPNICKLLETYDEGKSSFLVMEYCDGGELFEHVARTDGRGLPEATCADVMRQCAGALKYAHGRGIAHRDLKPENVCLCGDSQSSQKKRSQWKGHVKVIDWGLSAFFGLEEARMCSNVGSVEYAAPEVLEGSRPSDGYTAACDLWSLGVMTYVSLSGRFPFHGGNSFEQLQNMRAAEYSLDGSLWGAISGDAKDFITSLLRRDAGSRPSAGEALEHPWLRRRRVIKHQDSARAHRVLANVQRASAANFPVAIFAALVARQLDHQSLRELPQVFLELDLDGSGQLELSEVKVGWEAIFGKNSQELLDVERTFELLDLDGSGAIDYTEFCAAGLGERLRSEEGGLKAAFKAFDIHDDNGRITRNEFEEVMSNANVGREVVAAERVFSEFDADGDGSLDFEEWMAWIKELLREGSPA